MGGIRFKADQKCPFLSDDKETAAPPWATLRTLEEASRNFENDENNTGAWEMATHDLAALCGLNVPEAKLEKFSSLGSTFLIKRFDRLKSKRVHFASAMTLLGKQTAHPLLMEAATWIWQPLSSPMVHRLRKI